MSENPSQLVCFCHSALLEHFPSAWTRTMLCTGRCIAFWSLKQCVGCVHQVCGRIFSSGKLCDCVQVEELVFFRGDAGIEVAI